jgi:methionyl-tRNA formyltransferase
MHGPEVVQQIAKWEPDLGLSLGAPALRKSLFRLPPLGTLNLHLGRLPEFRGGPPAFWELFRGSDRIGATVHWIDERLDTGDVAGSAEAPIYRRDSLKTAEARAAELGATILVLT